MGGAPAALTTTSLKLAILAGAVTFGGSAFAQEREGAEDLEAVLQESVVATPTRSTGVASAAPATTSTVSAEDLQRYGIRSLAEAIDFLSLGMVTQSDTSRQRSGMPMLGARGVLLNNNNQVLLLLNGH